MDIVVFLVALGARTLLARTMLVPVTLLLALDERAWRPTRRRRPPKWGDGS
jgi:hypothetical protein